MALLFSEQAQGLLCIPKSLSLKLPKEAATFTEPPGLILFAVIQSSLSAAY